jgi:hypothetical protein
MCVLVCSPFLINAHAYMYMRSHTLSCTHFTHLECTHAHAHTHTHTYTHTHIYTHTHTHMYTHRDIIFLFKYMMAPTAEAFPPITPWIQKAAKLKWKYHSKHGYVSPTKHVHLYLCMQMNALCISAFVCTCQVKALAPLRARICTSEHVCVCFYLSLLRMCMSACICTCRSKKYTQAII